MGKFDYKNGDFDKLTKNVKTRERDQKIKSQKMKNKRKQRTETKLKKILNEILSDEDNWEIDTEIYTSNCSVACGPFNNSKERLTVAIKLEFACYTNLVTKITAKEYEHECNIDYEHFGVWYKEIRNCRLKINKSVYHCNRCKTVDRINIYIYKPHEEDKTKKCTLF